MSTADITLVNLNMLLIRYVDAMEREPHVTLGPLYLTAVLEEAGFRVDFRDYQMCNHEEPFYPESLVEFCADPAPVIGLSCMANLLPFTVLAAEALAKAYPDCTLVLGGVGPKSVEDKLLERFPWIDIVAHGEGERSIVALMKALRSGAALDEVPGIFFRQEGQFRCNPPAARIDDLDALPRPAFEHIDYSRYAGHNMITSRGCPYLCTFCSVAPIWGRQPHFRKPESIVDEMTALHREQGVKLFLFQDEFFLSSKQGALAFCSALQRAGLDIHWKAFARIDLADEEVMQAMADAGCVEIRFGIESGSNRILKLVNKGFTIEQANEVVAKAVLIFPRVDTFFIWGFPFETMEDFHQTVFQMISFRLIGARILPSLLSLLPQTEIYKEIEDKSRLEFFPALLPEYMLTGHEICDDGHLQVSPKHAFIFDFIQQHPDIFSGFFLLDVQTNILPKFQILREHGFYASKENEVSERDSCGAHSPRLTHEQAIGAITRRSS
ncbi:MAG: radical SAM protein [Myxococcota bacterium]|jgi:radical SAM superfamily enzyme YgiQ (UPF0313 family)|nr:radical SAM protein [Myxococcota bacterium]